MRKGGFSDSHGLLQLCIPVVAVWLRLVDRPLIPSSLYRATSLRFTRDRGGVVSSMPQATNPEQDLLPQHREG